MRYLSLSGGGIWCCHCKHGATRTDATYQERSYITQLRCHMPGRREAADNLPLMLDPLHEHSDRASIDLTILLGLIDHQLLLGFGMQGEGEHLIVTPLEVAITARNGCMHGNASIWVGRCDDMARRVWLTKSAGTSLPQITKGIRKFCTQAHRASGYQYFNTVGYLC